LAGSHLLDPATGEYNRSYIAKYLPDTPVQVVGLVKREQGLIVAKGNPLGLQTLADLAQEDVQFVNRQRGAGTRVLFDYQLELGGISAETIQGYDQEEFTHLAVAAAIASGRASAGLGIAAAAHALDLDFIPLFHERYELIIPDQFAHSDLLAPLLNLLHNDRFRQAVAALPGYDVSIMGLESR
ncbi:MAG TPA: molybdopterin biosynthesis protein, partial [Anaerolineae bacterium]|nr:molybdopterin biosynthesis protein [Anaerolineae bacterium]